MQSKKHIERKGIFSFLFITFAVTYLLEGALIASGFRFTPVPGAVGQIVVAAAMWVPAVATLITVRFSTHEQPALGNWRFGPWRSYLGVAVVLPVAYAVIYSITWMLGLAQPDRTLEQFRAIFLSQGIPIPPIPDPTLVLLGLFLASTVAGPFLNTLFAMGEEIGWRGYLLPGLMPLGKTKAYIILGVIWGVWHTPIVLIGFTYSDQPILGAVMFVALTTAFGIYINELTLQNGSCLIAAWAHSIFNSRKLGVWSLLFPKLDPLLGGFAGIIGIVVWLGLGLWQMKHAPAMRLQTLHQFHGESNE